jgi:Spy/CpxP family protein refolding chaperone
MQYAALGVCLLAGGALAHGQRGPGGGGPGGPPGGGMGGPGGGGMMGGPRGERDMEPRIQQRQPVRSEPQLSLPGRWWDDKKTVKTLSLRSDQQKRMDDIFEAGKGNLVSLYENLQREQQRFVSMPREDLQDETKVFAAIDRVAAARADLEKANFHMLLQIRKEMDPEQVAALDKQIASGQ